MDIAVLEKRAEKLRAQAELSGADNDMRFSTTYDRYIEQYTITKALYKKVTQVIEDDDILIRREYIKGQENTIVHPVIREYNNAASSANKTLDCLGRIIRDRKGKESGDDPLLAVLLDGDDDE